MAWTRLLVERVANQPLRVADAIFAIDAVAVRCLGRDEHALFAPFVAPGPTRQHAAPRPGQPGLYRHAEELGHAGQQSLVGAMGSEMMFGDIFVEVLAFHGEQPTRDAPGAAALDDARSGTRPRSDTA